MYTYDEWKTLGYHVTKGEKACGRNKQGKALFSLDQVEEDIDYDSYGDGYEYEGSWEETLGDLYWYT